MTIDTEIYPRVEVTLVLRKDKELAWNILEFLMTYENIMSMPYFFKIEGPGLEPKFNRTNPSQAYIFNTKIDELEQSVQKFLNKYRNTRNSIAHCNDNLFATLTENPKFFKAIANYTRLATDVRLVTKQLSEMGNAILANNLLDACITSITQAEEEVKETLNKVIELPVEEENLSKLSRLSRLLQSSKSADKMLSKDYSQANHY